MNKVPWLLFCGFVAAILSGCATEQLTPIAFSPTRWQFVGNDVIMIDEVLASSPELAIGTSIVVRGHYYLQSHPDANIGVSLSTKGPGVPTRVQPRSQARVEAGTGQFELRYEIHSPGALHVSFYPDSGESFGGVYFASIKP